MTQIDRPPVRQTTNEVKYSFVIVNELLCHIWGKSVRRKRVKKRMQHLIQRDRQQMDINIELSTTLNSYIIFEENRYDRSGLKSNCKIWSIQTANEVKYCIVIVNQLFYNIWWQSVRRKWIQKRNAIFDPESQTRNGLKYCTINDIKLFCNIWGKSNRPKWFKKRLHDLTQTNRQ